MAPSFKIKKLGIIRISNFFNLIIRKFRDLEIFNFPISKLSHLGTIQHSSVRALSRAQLPKWSAHRMQNLMTFVQLTVCVHVRPRERTMHIFIVTEESECVERVVESAKNGRQEKHRCRGKTKCLVVEEVAGRYNGYLYYRRENQCRWE